MTNWEFGFGYPTVEIKDGALKFGRGFNLDKHIPLNTITGLSYDGGGMFSGKYTVKIFIGGALGSSFETPKTQKFERYIKEIISSVDKYKQQLNLVRAVKPTEKESSFSVADELQKLASLRDAGVLTPDEFDTQKQKILSR